jgi:hypothetical protein
MCQSPQGRFCRTVNEENTDDGTPEAEATNEEVFHCVKSMLRDIADTRGARRADNLIKLLKHKSLDLTWLRASEDSVAQMREEESDEAQRWLAALDFVEKPVRDPEEQFWNGVVSRPGLCSQVAVQQSRSGRSTI